MKKVLMIVLLSLASAHAQAGNGSSGINWWLSHFDGRIGALENESRQSEARASSAENAIEEQRNQLNSLAAELKRRLEEIEANSGTVGQPLLVDDHGLVIGPVVDFVSREGTTSRYAHYGSVRVWVEEHDALITFTRSGPLEGKAAWCGGIPYIDLLEHWFDRYLVFKGKIWHFRPENQQFRACSKDIPGEFVGDLLEYAPPLRVVYQ